MKEQGDEVKGKGEQMVEGESGGADYVGDVMFSQMVETALRWSPEKRHPRGNYTHRIGGSGERRIIRMAKAGYNVWETWQILGAYDYSTIQRIYKQNGFDTRGGWA